MASALHQHDKTEAIHAAIVDFLSDSTRVSLKLPQMTADQRKETKALLTRYPELICESYGFGEDRSLHLFKNKATSDHLPVASKDQLAAGFVAGSFSVKNTFIEDWAANEAQEGPRESICWRSMPPKLGKSTRDYSHDHSTAASSPILGPSSPRLLPALEESTLQEVLRSPPGLEIRNTFIHFAAPMADERNVQSMPHGMFWQSLATEVSKPRVADTTRANMPQVIGDAPNIYHRSDSLLIPGTQVVIEGLQRLPCFNGVTAFVEAFDSGCGRYSVVFHPPVGGHTSAKVKGENLRQVLPVFDQTLLSDSLTWPATPGDDRHECLRTLLQLNELVA